MELFTIGHSNHSIDEFIALLKKHNITALADVRSHPYSRYLPHFCKNELQQALEKAQIRYVFLGQELGARPDNPECYINGKAVYEKIAATELFNQGLDRILKGVHKYRIALMCAEQDPLTCHRAILVCQNLKKFDLDIKHILKTGELETHEHLEVRLLTKHKFTQVIEQKSPIQLSLFDQEPSLNQPQLTKEEYIKHAYQLQGEQIAYVEKDRENE